MLPPWIRAEQRAKNQLIDRALDFAHAKDGGTKTEQEKTLRALLLVAETYGRARMRSFYCSKQQEES